MATEVDKLTLASHPSGDFSVRELNTELLDLRRNLTMDVSLTVVCFPPSCGTKG